MFGSHQYFAHLGNGTVQGAAHQPDMHPHPAGEITGTDGDKPTSHCNFSSSGRPALSEKSFGTGIAESPSLLPGSCDPGCSIFLHNRQKWRSRASERKGDGEAAHAHGGDGGRRKRGSEALEEVQGQPCGAQGLSRGPRPLLNGQLDHVLLFKLWRDPRPLIS